MGWVKNIEEVFISTPFFSIIKEQGNDRKETTPAVPFYFYFTGISLITRAGLPPNTTLSPKDLVITAPAPATKCNSRQDNDATTSPEIVSDCDRLTVLDT